MNIDRIVKKIIKSTNKLPKTLFVYYHLINELILINLETENILLKKNKNPKQGIINLLVNLDKKIQIVKNTNKFSNLRKIKCELSTKEKSHKKLFNKLWVNYTKKQYVEERIQRYIKRIKINKIIPKIKNKTIVDFGCGHGNFLIAASLLGAKKCIGIDYGKDSILYANQITKKLGLTKKVKFYKRDIYNSKFTKNSFDFAIQNGVFHHLKNPDKAYQEIYRVLKPGGFFWTYTDGGGGVRDLIGDLSQDILKNLDINFKLSVINNAQLNYNKRYHISDNINAKYTHYLKNDYIKYLKKFGFKNFHQAIGGMPTDSDLTSKNDKFFKEKFGSGDLRFIIQK
tara:strand:- start:250 stop:1272 length:1023 start_codon:yes stop_codon:yes gene_type:complete